MLHAQTRASGSFTNSGNVTPMDPSSNAAKHLKAVGHPTARFGVILSQISSGSSASLASAFALFGARA